MRYSTVRRYVALGMLAVWLTAFVVLIAMSACAATPAASAPGAAPQLQATAAADTIRPAPAAPGFIYIGVPLCPGDLTGVRTLASAGRTWLYNPTFGERRFPGDSLRILFIDCDGLLRREGTPLPWHGRSSGHGST